MCFVLCYMLDDENLGVREKDKVFSLGIFSFGEINSFISCIEII